MIPGLGTCFGSRLSRGMSRHSRSGLRALAVRQQRRLRESEAAFILLAAMTGIAAGISTNVQQFLAHGIQRLLYGVTINRLSALGSIHHPWRLLSLPLGGAMLVLFSMAVRRHRRAPIDVVEANALHGGRIPFIDSVVVAGQTIISNGAGASVGLEAAYAQMGGGIASVLGQWLHLRRNDLRILVGAGAGAAVGAAFGAPLTGAFYAFEIVIGYYTPAAIAPVLAASLTAVFVTRSLGVQGYLIATTSDRVLTAADYAAYSVLGLLCACLGIAIMRLVTLAEQKIPALPAIGGWKPVIGGILLMPLAFLSPQTLSAGHGALHLNLLLKPAVDFLLVVLVLKIAASVISLSFGFRGGLFFASLFLGSVAGQLFAGVVDLTPLQLHLDGNDAALVGMAALSVSIVGGPITLAMLMLETTHDFTLMGVVLTAAMISSAFTREVFGYSFSTWRLHVRGSLVRSPRDIGWNLTLAAERIMRKDWVAVDQALTVGEYRQRVALGSTSKTILVDDKGRYRGIVLPVAVHRPDIADDRPIASLAILADTTLTPATGIDRVLQAFDRAAVDEMAVVDPQGRVLGVVTEKYARRRYFEALETAQREIFGED